MRAKDCVIQCPRCGGRGRIPIYGHVLKGICFLCNGEGCVVRSLRTARERAGLSGAGIGSKAVPRSLALVPAS